MDYNLFFLAFALFASIEWNGDKLLLSESEWKEKLGEERYEVMRKKGTERAFSGRYLFTSLPGTYVCAGCALPFFRSEDKYDAGSGWASFRQTIHSKNVYYLDDSTPYVRRYEVLCSRCGSHLGHVFHDGPPPKQLRYCINSLSLRLIGETLCP